MCDYRNNLFSPSEGWFLEAGSRFYRPFLGSRFIYDTYWIDVRKYFHVGKKSLFAAQGFTQISTGEVPIMEKNRLGGSNMMRGFFLGRYRDNVYGMVQSEFRHPLHRLITGAIFVAAGQTAPSLSQASLQRTLIAGGAGVRLLVNKKKSVFLRIDLAVNQYGGLGYYLRVGDAF
jgi:outer membrane protein assembly factor BamA